MEQQHDVDISSHDHAGRRLIRPYSWWTRHERLGAYVIGYGVVIGIWVLAAAIVVLIKAHS